MAKIEAQKIINSPTFAALNLEPDERLGILPEEALKV
jgi:hypothetical protein